MIQEPQPGRVGPKTPVTGAEAVCSSQHPLVTDAMLAVLRGGGNAIDAGIAGCLLQSTVQQEMTNHTGTITLLYFEAATGRIHELNGMGTIVPDLAPFYRVPLSSTSIDHGSQTTSGPYAVIPGFMPSMKALYERFATRPWAELCEPAVHWAEVGHEVNSFEHRVLSDLVDIYLYTPSGREHFTPHGHLPQVGDRWPKPVLAETLRNLASEGPDYFITGGWAQHFVARANEIGWPIELRHLAQIPPRWGEGTRYRHGEHEIVQLSPPERQAVFCSIVLGILEELDIASLGHPSESAEAAYYMAHALRRADYESGFVNDPTTFGVPLETLLSPDYHRLLASVLRGSRPTVDLRRHVELTSGPATVVAAGGTSQPSMGSCEISVVDTQGNWLQLMNTLQSGGIPGEVVDGVPMLGSEGVTSLTQAIGGWFTGGGRMRSTIGNTMVLREGRPWLALGTPGYVHWTVPQVLSNILDYGMDPYSADDAPRMFMLEDKYLLPVESRLSPAVIDGLAGYGVRVMPRPRYDYHMGTFQTSWRDADGLLHGSTGPRRSGKAAAF